MILFWQYVLIGIGVAIEGPGVTLAAAALAGNGLLNPFLVFAVAGVGNLTADMIWYLLGYYGGFEHRLQQWPRFARFGPQIIQLKEGMAQNAMRLLFTAKLSLGIGSIPALIAAGIVRTPWPRVLLVQTAGEIIWTGALVLIGFFLGQYVPQIEKDMRIAAGAGGVLLLILLAVWLRRRLGGDKKNEHKLMESLL